MSRTESRPIRWTLTAERELNEIADYIAADNPVAATDWGREIKAKVELLRVSPYLGAILPGVRSARYLTHGSYATYYTVHQREVVVRAVVHGARRFRPMWLRRE
jgi:toxin ParE1/3/4